jgi:hypothetical protein
MGLIFSDGFDLYGATADVLHYWGAVNSPWAWNATAGRNGGGAMVATTNAGAILQVPTGSTPVPIVGVFAACFWLKMSATPSVAQNLFRGLEIGGGVEYWTQVTTGGFLTFNNVGNGSAIFTGNINVCDNNWHWVEMEGTVGTGVHKCYVDTIAQWNSPSVGNGSGSGPIDHFTFTAMTTLTMTIDDFFVCTALNGLAPQPSGVPFGPMQISTKQPSSDTATVQFNTSSGSAHFSLVNESAPDYDTTYVQSNASGNEDLYNYAALGFSPAAVLSVNLKSLVENPGAGTVNHKNTCLSNGTGSDGASTITPSSYQVKNTIYDQDPHTSAVWSGTNVDAAQFGIKVA